ncbi:hypothetical protein SERLA73DRAFT_176518 [Serpula lacrymans var. lacrymans S7.3]|uniref:Uncharacterized protein n=2 Tax=Serpula lacrymans var. lacrymans TaxID=341189 RepID=F8PN38_SERL3|nr:uncharacterized protein SERLADRAFT_459403 [Serpula lacrymans var. lacrymans S7.9]EGO03020.1 hypothetical protein SERLA73DRAFT_176518 [Serpula lacrymans var. lacrymans S7.3]EGO28698.1 hypothetical protein SERLADRAFT_459403 [Serpula lacrymans var. lacrymans S7.9]
MCGVNLSFDAGYPYSRNMSCIMRYNATINGIQIRRTYCEYGPQVDRLGSGNLCGREQSMEGTWCISANLASLHTSARPFPGTRRTERSARE